MIELNGVSTRYGSVPMLRDVSLRVGAGELVCLLGPNGAGKTTLFKTVAGLIRPTAGAVQIMDAAPNLRTERIARLGVGFVPENRRLFAGLTVALVLIPQSMAYAQLAGLPAYYGLYASFLPPMVAALFGSSRQLATGPVAVVSLMTFASLAPLASAGSDAFIGYAVLLALMVGFIQLGLGIFRLGLVVNFLSHPVVNGFTNAAAIIIASSQLSKLFGVNVDTAAHHYETILRVVQAATHYTHWPTFGLGVLAAQPGDRLDDRKGDASSDYRRNDGSNDFGHGPLLSSLFRSVRRQTETSERGRARVQNGTENLGTEPAA